MICHPKMDIFHKNNNRHIFIVLSKEDHIIHNLLVIGQSHKFTILNSTHKKFITMIISIESLLDNKLLIVDRQIHNKLHLIQSILREKKSNRIILITNSLRHIQ